MIEALLKYSKEQPEETATLQKALESIKVSLQATPSWKVLTLLLLDSVHGNNSVRCWLLINAVDIIVAGNSSQHQLASRRERAAAAATRNIPQN